MSLKAPRVDVIDSPMSKWSVWLLAAASTVAGMEAVLPSLQGILPPHWYAIALPVILVARIVKQNIPQ